MHVTDDGGVLRITFDRPDSLNAFTGEAAAELADHLEAADPDVHDAAVLTGEGRAFSAGGDVEAMAEREETPDEAADRLRETAGRAAESILFAPLPVIARINGDAVGAGMSIVALCDFAYAVESARFGAAFVRVGLVPDMGWTAIVPRMIGVRAARRLALTGELVGAEEAADLGLVDAVVPADGLDDAVDELLGTLRDRPTRTTGLIKRAIHGNLGRGLGDALDYEALVQSQAYGTPEHGEGVRAFLEGRDPEF